MAFTKFQQASILYAE